MAHRVDALQNQIRKAVEAAPRSGLDLPDTGSSFRRVRDLRLEARKVAYAALWALVAQLTASSRRLGGVPELVTSTRT
jgi:hypothetical protein